MDSASEPLTCPKCGAKLALEALGGLCPRCTFAAAFEESPEEENGETLSPHDIPPAGTSVSYIGDYQLLEVIAYGGMGVVYKARQRSLDRLVALKLLLGGAHAHPDFKQRLRLEAKLAARLNHPNIVPIYEVGEHEGQPYFAMEFIAGETLAHKVRERPLPQTEAANFVKTVAEAVHYAHEQGVLHRDLKPSNILVGADGRPRVTDFGLARTVEAGTSLTSSGQALGTPGYLPPEQAAGNRGEVGPRSDVYALGAVLYCLATGRPPFAAATVVETLLQVVEAEPASLRKLNAAVSKDLDTICLKCLEKDAGRRYVTAQELAKDLDRFLDGEPILARPISSSERIVKWVKRQPALAAVSGIAVLAGAVGFAGILSQWQRAETEHERVQNLTSSSTATFGEAQSRLAEVRFAEGDSHQAILLLAAGLRRNSSNDLAAERLVAASSQRNWALPLGPPMVHTNRGVMGAVNAARFSPDGNRVVTAGEDSLARIWEAGSGRLLHVLAGHSNSVTEAEFSPDGRLVVTTSDDSTARLWNVDTGEQVGPVLPHPDGVWSPRFSADGRWLVTASANAFVGVWRVEAGTLERKFGGHTQAVTSVRFAPAGAEVLTASADGTAQIWDAISGRLSLAPLRHPHSVTLAEFSPDGQLVLTLAGTNLWVWNRRDGTLVTNGVSHALGFATAEFSPDSQRILTCSTYRLGAKGPEVQVWDTRSGSPTTPPMPHVQRVWVARFSPEGLRVLTSSEDYRARVWDARTGLLLFEPLQHHGTVPDAQFSSDGQRVVTASVDGSARMWDARPGKAQPLQLRPPGAVGDVALHPDGRRLAMVTANRLEFWDVVKGQMTATATNIFPVAQARYSPDGRRLVTLSTNRTVLRLWDAETGAALGSPLQSPTQIRQCLSSLFSPDSRRLAVPCGTNGVLVWDGTNILKTLTQPLAACAAWSADGKQIATTSSQDQDLVEVQLARVWDANTGRLIATLEGTGGPVRALSFSPDGRKVAAASLDESAYVWEIATSNLLARCRHREAVIDVQFSPDGGRLVTASLDGTARLWDAATGAEAADRLQHGARVISARFSPDGRHMLTASWDRTIRLWDERTGLPASEPLLHGERVTFAELTSDAARIVTRNWNTRAASVWKLPGLPAPRHRVLLAELAEALNSVRWRAGGAHEEVFEDTLARFRKIATTGDQSDPFIGWLRWFLADRSEREIACGETARQPERLRWLLAENATESLEEAVMASPTNTVALVQLARAALRQAGAPRRLGEAQFYVRRALQYRPEDRDALAVQKEVEAEMAEARPARPR